jgi:hypothetical protein
VDSFSQRVAIKLFHETQLAAAVDQEHHLLSSLDHPNIVRLLDQGTSENGRRYLVMEFVDGVPIDQYCNIQRLSVAGRIELLMKVLHALSYSQRYLVVHADIKPSNILVDATGEPKLLDFGIGRRTRIAGGTVQGTHVKDVQYTPAFASPEQLAGEPVSAASDIYSAGLVARLVLGESASGDLALILAKATRTEPNLRYGSAQEFADDLRALLDHRPVHARKGSWRYRAGKWLRRNRIAAAVTVTLLAVFAVSVVGVFVQTVRAIHQRHVATARLYDIVRLTGTLEGELYDSVHSLAQGDQAGALLLQEATRSLDNVAADSEGDTTLELEVAQQYGKLARIERTRHGDDQAAAASAAKGLALLHQIPRSDRNYSAAQTQAGDLIRLQSR